MTARSAAAENVIRRARAYPQMPLETVPDANLSARDDALARAIDHAVARRWLTLVAVLSRHLRQPWPEIQPELQAALLTGTAQLLLFDRLPEHAVINEAVEWTKHRVRAKAGGLVNAVLRKVAGARDQRLATFNPAHADELPLAEGGAWKLCEATFADDPIERLAQQTSHPTNLLRHWHKQLTPMQADALALHNIVHPPIIVAGLPEDTPQTSPHSIGGFRVFEGFISELGALLHQVPGARPGARVQDPAIAAAVQQTRDLQPHTIIDFCAGQGTKTLQLCELHPSARIIATDIDDKRLTVLRETFAKDEQVHVVAFDEIGAHSGEADLVMLDVPCSNTGVLARRVEAKYRWSAQSMNEVTALQRQIIADSLRLLRERACLLYITCSIDPAENQQQMSWLQKWHAFEMLQEMRTLPSGRPGDAPALYHDGAYAALMQRTG